MKILITGATGRIGRELTRRFGKNHELILLGRKSYEPEQGRYWQLDIKHRDGVEKLISNERPEAIVHLAGLLGDSQMDPDSAHEINVGATEFLAKVAQANEVKSFVFASSSAVYDQTELEPTDEFHNLNPKSVYGKTKLLAEKTLQGLSKDGVTKIACLRLFNVYGPEFTDSLVYKLLRSQPDHPVMVYGPDNFYRDYVYVSDVARAFEKSLEPKQNYAVYNVGSGKAINNGQLIKELEESGAKIYFDVKESETSISWANINLISKELGWLPERLIKDAVNDER